jgi:hypothetical protein
VGPPVSQCVRLCVNAGRCEEAAMVKTQTLAMMSWSRMGGLHGARDGGFGTLLVSVVLVAVVVWVLARGGRNAV